MRTGGSPAALIFTRATALRSGSTRAAMIAAASSLSARCSRIPRCVTGRRSSYWIDPDAKADCPAGPRALCDQTVRAPVARACACRLRYPPVARVTCSGRYCPPRDGGSVGATHGARRRLAPARRRRRRWSISLGRCGDSADGHLVLHHAPSRARGPADTSRPTSTARCRLPQDDRVALWSTSSRTSALFSGTSAFHMFWATSHAAITRVRCVLRWSDSSLATRRSHASSRKMPAPDLPPTVQLVEVDPPVMAPPSTSGRGRTIRRRRLSRAPSAQPRCRPQG